VLRICRNLHQ